MHEPATGPVPPAPRTSRRWTLVGAEGAVDVEVTARECDALGHVLPALARELGVPCAGLWNGSSRLPDSLALSSPVLAHGAVLGLDRPVGAAGGQPRGSALELHVVGGPEAGRTQPLGQGAHVLGRGSEATFSLEDPDVSRRHVSLHVGGGRITVADLGSTNGSRLDDQELSTEPQSWPVGGVLRLGTSALILAAAVQPGAGLTPAVGGRVLVRPVPRLDAPVGDVEVVFPRAPSPPPRRRLAWVAIALPAVGGVAMAWLLDAPMFLFFAVLSPVVALGTWLSERWSGRRSGRREAAAHAVEVADAEQRLAEAVQASVRADETAHPDLATLVSAARRRTGRLWSRAAEDGDAWTVRLGTGPGVTRVVRVDDDGSRTPQITAHRPAVVDLRRAGGLTVVGPQEYARGVLRSAVAQLSALLPPGALRLVLLLDTTSAAAWRWARWLPHLSSGSVHVHSQHPSAASADERLLDAVRTLVAQHRAGQEALGRSGTQGFRTSTVVVIDRSLDHRLAAVLEEAVAHAGVFVLTWGSSAAAVPVSTGASMRLGGETGTSARLSRRGTIDLAVESVDRLPACTAADFARDLACLVPAATPSALPSSVRLLELPAPGIAIDTDIATATATATGTDTDTRSDIGITPGTGDGRPGGGWSPSRDRLLAVLGRTADGLATVDLCRDGPHALVAGTTGSGKSELLQTLIASLALAHPPQRCSFLLVDYKGGAAFAEASALPHTVGLVTDLDSQTTTRALRSLTAELVRRETILAAHQVADLSDLPAAIELARLVIVVDEFATLAVELPSFVPGLVSIAQRGRSLGVHLVLATQRPAGVVSPEIRANCSLRICLRTVDEADSRDVLGASSAAFLPVDLPGRAYLRTGSAAPVLLQVARVSSSSPPSRDATPEVRRAGWPDRAGSALEDTAGESDLARVVDSLTRYARATGGRPPHRPWALPLPDHLETSDIADPGGEHPRTRLRLGLVDHPEAQDRRPLLLDLAEGGTWLAVGGPRSGRSTLLRTVVQEAAAARAADELHIHVVESGGGPLTADAAALPHVGTLISGPDRLRTARLVERLDEEIAARRAAPASDRPAILLLVDGIERVIALVEDALPGHGTATLERLLRDGAAAGLTCVMTADRAIPGSRLAGLSRHRLVLPLADRADYAVAGVPPRSVPEHRPPGRALLGDEALECQLAVPRAVWEPITTPAVDGRRPLTIPELPADPVLPPDDRPPAGNPPGPPRLVVGPGGDEGRPLAVDVFRSGGLLVAGPPGSGRTSALDAFAHDLDAAGVPLLRLDHRARPASEARNDGRVASSDPGAVREWVEGLGGGIGVVLADDVGTPAECAGLAALAAPGGQVAVIAAGQAAQLATHFQGPVAALRRAGTGLLLCPAPGDADLLGVRLPRTPVPVRPGSGWLVAGSRVDRVQVARRRTAETTRC